MQGYCLIFCHSAFRSDGAPILSPPSCASVPRVASVGVLCRSRWLRRGDGGFLQGLRCRMAGENGGVRRYLSRWTCPGDGR